LVKRDFLGWGVARLRQGYDGFQIWWELFKFFFDRGAGVTIMSRGEI